MVKKSEPKKKKKETHAKSKKIPAKSKKNNDLKNKSSKKTVPSIKTSEGFEKMINHIKTRIKLLKSCLQMIPELHVRIAGKSNIPNLGKGLAKDQWKIKGYSTQQYNNFIKELDKGLLKLKSEFPKRVTFGNIDGSNASDLNYQVWGANAKNYNLPTNSFIKGRGQARAVDRQYPGVFGIVTTPINGIP